ncbi:dihydrolipoamide acetyltransferase family protein [Marisediminicola antarctica]|uniref:Dihydrolipoamide acetyltransferase component of pyruvate dehydrogenase complex n=1 Tax=Marisediminicola antarctica TaxID=674079 RepID=A0A7L5AFV9_9MICO|nr:dihydrolipoamide acetyltransferase family protein [Marisediminicola antarctica]QHO68595.1 branched-chain alpha-keto acid dehydrogenase subunit E2 [Marisediminicola antarctica]
MSSREFNLPDVGEGLTEAEIVAWKVAEGDTVTVNQVLVEIETAKSLVELPSPFAGVVTKLLVEEGTMVDIGTAIISVSDAGAPATPDATPDAAPASAAAPAAAPAPSNDATETIADTAASIAADDDKPGAVLVGYGIKGHVAPRRNRQSAADAPPTRAAARPSSVPAASASAIIAKPPIRKLAKDLGVDLATVTATGLAGEITRDDVVREASQASLFRNIETPQWATDREERIPVKGVRKAIASTMVSSAFSAPHVSLFVDVDATRTMEFVKRLKNSPDFAGVKVSPLLIMAKAMIWAVRRNPTANAQWTDEEIVVKHYVNFGIAAATPRGLIVPNIKEAQDLPLIELARAIEQLTITAREGRTQPSAMAGGTITITNIGVFGMDTGTPILNSDEVAIVALGTIKQKPWVVDGEVRPRFVTTLGASFDHRVVDGDVASRFLADVASIIEEPALLLD